MQKDGGRGVGGLNYVSERGALPPLFLFLKVSTLRMSQNYRPRSVGWRMKFSTWLGNSPKYNVPATVKAKTKFTVSGNPTGPPAFPSALHSPIHITTITPRQYY